MALVAWWHARVMEGFALEGAWLDDCMARADGAIYLRVGGPHFWYYRELCWGREVGVFVRPFVGRFEGCDGIDGMLRKCALLQMPFVKRFDALPSEVT